MTKPRLRAEGNVVALQTPIAAAPPPAFRDRLRRVLRAALREPLLHFVLIGALIFAFSNRFEERTRRYAIEVTPEQLTRVIQTYEQQYGGEPTPEQVRALIDSYVKEEIYLREGVALGLDKDDEIVRRRVAQKFEFLEQDRAAPPPPTLDQLKAYYAAHLAAYRHPATRSFDQIYFAMDQRGEDGARHAAQATLDRLRAGSQPGAGDPFPGPAGIRMLSQEEVARLFGGDDFAAAAFKAPPGRWAGPFRSGYGWHVVRVTEDAPPRQRSFAEAQADVGADWQQAERSARNDAAYRDLLARYHVTVAGTPR